MGKYYLTDGKYLLGYGECQNGHEHLYDGEGWKVELGEPPDNLRPPPLPDDAYDKQRAMAYPPLADFVDAWVKGDDAAMERYRAACVAVKQRFPKPSN